MDRSIAVPLSGLAWGVRLGAMDREDLVGQLQHAVAVGHETMVGWHRWIGVVLPFSSITTFDLGDWG